jgi:hypothetical protein
MTDVETIYEYETGASYTEPERPVCEDCDTDLSDQEAK